MSIATQHRVNGAAQRVAEPLYEYVPVPPFAVDDDGYLVGDSMASESTSHRRQGDYWRSALSVHFRHRALVVSELSMPYRRGCRRAVVVPDLFVTFGARRLDHRSSYKLWEEPAPDLVIEALSPSTRDEDLGAKKRTYEALGVREYWLFDPLGGQLVPPLAGYALVDGVYRPIAFDLAGHARSEVLGLEMRVVDGDLRFFDPATGEHLLTYEQEREARLKAQRQATRETHRRRAAEERIAALEAQLQSRTNR